MSLSARIRALEEVAPKGYRTFDPCGNTVIRSDMDALDWYTSATELLAAKGRRAEKETLRAQLARSEKDNCGGLIFELVAALDSEEK